MLPMAAQDGDTPLHFAALNGSMNVASLLLQRGADVEFEDKVANASWPGAC
jgi:ankyrin repeat protein